MADRLTQETVAFADSLTFAALPADVIDAAKRCLVDGVGVAIAGLETDVVGQLKNHFKSSGESGPCRLFGDPEHKATAAQAALYFGISGNALDWDDVQRPEGDARPFGLLMHGTSPILATLIAVTDLVRGEAGRVVTGEEFLTAFVAGWEVSGKLALTVTPDHYAQGFHTSGTLGTFGCAIAAGKLLGLTAEQLTWGIGHAASMAAGVQASMGTKTKPMHVGWCAARGIEAALLARAGLDGAADALDGPRGYLTTTSSGADVTRVAGCFGNPFVLASPGVSAKPYPCGAVTHPGMDALSRAMSDNDFAADDIKSIVVSAGAQMWGVITYPFAETPFQAKYCFPFLLAAIVLRGGAGRAEFREAFIQSDDCVAFQKKVETKVDDALGDGRDDIIATRLDIETQDGRTITVDGRADYPGGPVVALDDEAVNAKFRDATAALLRPEKAMTLNTMLRTFETQADAGALLDAVGKITVPLP